MDCKGCKVKVGKDVDYIEILNQETEEYETYCLDCLDKHEMWSE